MWTPRPYKIVVLSDHGQTQGATFQQRCRPDAGRTRRRAVRRSDVRRRRRRGGDAPSRPHGCARPATRTVRPTRSPPTSRSCLGSGSLGLISLPGHPAPLDARGDRRALSAADPRSVCAPRDRIRARAPGSAARRWCSGNTASLDLATGEVVGDDPLRPFGPRASDQVTEVDGYTTVADLMVNSRYDPELRGGVPRSRIRSARTAGSAGRRPTRSCCTRRELTPPADDIFTSPAMYRVLKGWLAEVGQ